MKKLISSIIIGIVFSQNCFAEISYKNQELSLLFSGSILLSPLLIPYSIINKLESLSKTNPNYQNNLKVKKIVQLNEKETLVNVDINLDNQVENFDLKLANNLINDMKVNDDILLKKNNIGYTISYNNKIIGISPNDNNKNYFIQEKV
jgi:hypothetical protein